MCGQYRCAATVADSFITQLMSLIVGLIFSLSTFVGFLLVVYRQRVTSILADQSSAAMHLTANSWSCHLYKSGVIRAGVLYVSTACVVQSLMISVLIRVVLCICVVFEKSRMNCLYSYRVTAMLKSLLSCNDWTKVDEKCGMWQYLAGWKMQKWKMWDHLTLITVVWDIHVFNLRLCCLFGIFITAFSLQFNVSFVSAE